MLWSGWIGLETWRYSYFRKAEWWWWLPEWLAGNFVYSDVRNSVCYMGYLQWSAWSTHCNLVILVRNRTIRAYVVVVLNVPSWLSGVLCYRGYKPAHAQQAPLWGGALKAGLQHSREEEGGAWSCIIQIVWLSPLFCQNSLSLFHHHWISELKCLKMTRPLLSCVQQSYLHV